MNQIDRGLAIREAQLKEAVDILTVKHGAQSETVALVRNRMHEVQDEIAECANPSDFEATGKERDTDRFSGIPRAKDSALLFVIIGGILIVAMGGISSMFILMLAAHW